MTKDKAYVDKVYTNPRAASKPVLLKFQNGNLAAVNKETTKFCRVEQENKRKGALVFASNNVYHGLFNERPNEELTDSYICIRNRTTNKVRIIPIEEVTVQNHIYRMLDKTRTLRLSDETSQTTLLKQFGGRKAASYATNKEKMNLDIGVLQNELDATISEFNITEEDDAVTGDEYFNLLRPKYQADATKLHEIYKIADVVPQELLDRLDEEAQVVLSTNVADLPLQSEYLKEQIKKIQNDTPSVEKTMHIKLFLYMDGLANLLKSRARNLTNLRLSDITEKVENDIRERFSDPYSKTKLRTKLSSEKGLCHYIVLALLTSDNYVININTLVQEIGVAKSRISKFAQISFAKKKIGSDILSLTLPSQVSKLSAKPRKTPNKKKS